MARIKAAFGETIRVDVPASNGNDYFPLCVALDNNNCFTASGGTDGAGVVQFLSVSGGVYGGPSASGQCNGLSWTLSVGPLAVGQVYCLNVSALTLFDDGSTETVQNHRNFITVRAGYYSCPSGHSPSGMSGQDESQSGTLPRYYRVRLSDEIPGLASPRVGLLLGGLLAPSTVYLAYDPAASVGSAPVWRDVNLPEFIGRWTLHVAFSGRGATAELVQQTVGPRYVSTGMVFRCTNWNSLRPNRFHLVGPQGGVGLSLIVEPA